jgi:3-methyladenine DNA glycosylase AlkD
MNLQEVMAYLESKGSEQTRKIFSNHGAPGNFYGVKVGDLKPLEKKLKHRHALALDLYATGNSDAQYLAGLIANPKEFTEAQLTQWAREAGWYMVSEYAVAWNVAEYPDCVKLCVQWIDSDEAQLQSTAWSALSAYLGIAPQEAIDEALMRSLLEKAEAEIHQAANRVRYTMNGFVIALGGAVASLSEACKAAGDRIGKVEVYMGKTACKVPVIRPYIEKMEDMGRIGVKKKTAKC